MIKINVKESVTYIMKTPVLVINAQWKPLIFSKVLTLYQGNKIGGNLIVNIRKRETE